jgi:hypothetical protein
MLLYVALSASALALLLVPNLRGAPLKALVLVLFLVEGIDGTLTAWRAGYLRMSLGQLAKNPPRSDPLQVFAFVIGAVAVFHAFHA